MMSDALLTTARTVNAAQHLCIPGFRVNVAHKVVLSLFLALILARMLILRTWQREFDISREFFFNLDVSGTDRYTTLAAEFSRMMNSSFCTEPQKYNYQWGAEAVEAMFAGGSSAGRFTFSDLECRAPCPLPYPELVSSSCVSASELVQRPSSTSVLVVTSARSNEYDNTSESESLYWIFSADALVISLSFNFHAPIPNFGQLLYNRNFEPDEQVVGTSNFGFQVQYTTEKCECQRSWRKTESNFSCNSYCCNPDADSGGSWCFVKDSSCQGKDWGYCQAKSMMTILVDTAGTVSRVVRVNEELSFTVPELLSLAGKADWLDSISESVGPNELRDAAFLRGASTRMTGGKLKILLSCNDDSDELDIDLGDLSWHEDYICSLRTTIQDSEFQHVSRSDAFDDTWLEKTFYGIEITVATDGFTHVTDPNALLDFLISSFVLMMIPGSIFLRCLLSCCGRLSRVYYHASYERFSFCDMITEMTVSNMQAIDSFKEIDDLRPNVSYNDDRKLFEGGISATEVWTLMLEIFEQHGGLEKDEAIESLIDAGCDIIWQHQMAQKEKVMARRKQDEQNALQNTLSGLRGSLTSSVSFVRKSRSSFTRELGTGATRQISPLGGHISAEGFLDTAHGFDKFSFGMFSHFLKKTLHGPLELFFTPLDFNVHYWEKIIAQENTKQRRKLPQEQQAPEAIIKMFGKPKREVEAKPEGEDANRYKTKEEILLDFMIEKLERWEKSVENVEMTMEAIDQQLEKEQNSFDTFEDSKGWRRRLRIARQQRKEKEMLASARVNMLSAILLLSPVPSHQSVQEDVPAVATPPEHDPSEPMDPEAVLSYARKARGKLKSLQLGISDRLAQLEEKSPKPLISPT